MTDHDRQRGVGWYDHLVQKWVEPGVMMIFNVAMGIVVCDIVMIPQLRLVEVSQTTSMLLPIHYLLILHRVLRAIDRTEVFSERDLSLFPNLVPGLGIWYHLYHPTLEQRQRYSLSLVPPLSPHTRTETEIQSESGTTSITPH